MLRFGSTQSRGDIEVSLDADTLPPGVNWIDAVAPSAPETRFIHERLGVTLPTLDRLSEIETSSRLYTDHGFLFMSMPMFARAEGGLPRTTPLGFVLGRDFLVTLRFEPIKSCDELHSHRPYENGRNTGGASALVLVLETIIDAIADELEKVNGELDALSQTIFDQGAASGSDVKRDNVILKRSLGAISGTGYLTSKISDTLLGLSRILAFVQGEAKDFIAAEENRKIKSLARDVSSLMDYARAQSERLQFILDATLGLTNIEQNNIFRLLTVVSVIGIPPTLVASMYGMNFKNMPELDWAWGYQWGLALIALSALVPAIWFKGRGWW
jgi:magnesium transporter